jgi:glycosyltransferase involved in cell wall biosynthesis
MSTFKIVTPSLNSADFINETIQSVISQAGNFEIRYHIQDGGSTDGTLEIIEKWTRIIEEKLIPINCKKIYFSYASIPDRGIYDAVNKGFEYEKVQDQDYLSWINSDDTFEPGAFALVDQIFSKFNDVEWLTGRTKHIAADGTSIGRFKVTPYVKRFLAAGLHDGRFFPLVSQEGTFWRGNIWKKSDGLKSQYKLAADYYLWNEFAKHTELAILTQSTASFRVHANQKSTDIQKYYAEINSNNIDQTEQNIKNAIADAIKVKEDGKFERSSETSWCFIAGNSENGFKKYRNGTNEERTRGIFDALYAEQHEIVEQYLINGVKTTVENENEVPFFIEAISCKRDIVFRLCEYYGQNFSKATTSKVQQKLLMSLFSAIEDRDALLVKKLVSIGTNIETALNGISPLFLSVHNDSLSITRALVEAGVNVNQINEQGSTPLLDAIYLGRESQVKLLVDSGASITHKNQGGQNALSLALAMGNTNIVNTIRNSFIEVCICTHNPRMDIFRLVISSLANQTVNKSRFRVLVVDNASDSPLTMKDLGELQKQGVHCRIVVESRLGNVFARAKAIAESSTDWILFVDDDNELASDYVQVGIDLIEHRKDLGCFGGRLDLANNLSPPEWMKPLLPYLAVRDFGDDEITNVANYWGKWEPATAGGFISRKVLDVYLNRIQNDEKVHQLGRKGKKSLNSGEDSLMMWGAAELGLAASYQPKLRLTHHLNPSRFNFKYFYRLMLGYGKSNCILDKLYNRVNAPTQKSIILKQIKHNSQQVNWRYALCLAAYQIGYNNEAKGI